MNRMARQHRHGGNSGHVSRPTINLTFIFNLRYGIVGSEKWMMRKMMVIRMMDSVVGLRLM